MAGREKVEFSDRSSQSLSRMLNIRNVRNAKLEFQIKCYLKNLSREQTSSDPKNLLRGEKEANTLWAGNYQADIKCVRGEAKKKKSYKTFDITKLRTFSEGNCYRNLPGWKLPNEHWTPFHIFIYIFFPPLSFTASHSRCSLRWDWGTLRTSETTKDEKHSIRMRQKWDFQKLKTLPSLAFRRRKRNGKSRQNIPFDYMDWSTHTERLLEQKWN